MSKYKKSTLACAVGGGLLAVALSFAQSARADEMTFLDALESDGLPAGSTALALGHMVCSDITDLGSDAVTAHVAMGLSTGMDPADVGHFISDAVNELCPSNALTLQTWARNHAPGKAA